MKVGDVLRDGGRGIRVREIRTRVDRRGDAIEHVTEVFTRGRHVPRAENVVRMPSGKTSAVAQFIRFHVLVRVYDGDPDAWLAAADPRLDDGDLRFLRLMRTRLRHDPSLLAGIREMVDTTRFWELVG